MTKVQLCSFEMTSIGKAVDKKSILNQWKLLVGQKMYPFCTCKPFFILKKISDLKLITRFFRFLHMMANFTQFESLKRLSFYNRIVEDRASFDQKSEKKIPAQSPLAYRHTSLKLAK